MFIEVLQIVALGDRDLVRFQTEYGTAWGLWEKPGVVQRRRYDVEFADSRVHTWGDTITAAGDGFYRIWEEGDLVCFGGIRDVFLPVSAELGPAGERGYYDYDNSTLRIDYSIFSVSTRGQPPPMGTPVVLKTLYWDLALYDTGAI